MSLRGPKVDKSEAAQSMTFRCPTNIKQYLEQTSEDEGRSQTEIILSGIELERDLALHLADDRERLHEAAARLGLDPDKDLAKLLASLVKHGLRQIDHILKAVPTRK